MKAFLFWMQLYCIQPNQLVVQLLASHKETV
jgi:hypothetical protein